MIIVTSGVNVMLYMDMIAREVPPGIIPKELSQLQEQIAIDIHSKGIN